jgi:ABC-type polysaccharide/polyol phosphate export permease
MVVNDLHLRYRRSVLGIGWSLLHPLATSLVIGAAFHEIFHRPIREYLPYLLCGFGIWAYLTGVASQGCQTYIQAEPYIRQHPLPLAVYPLRTTLGLMIHFLISMVLVTCLSIGLRGWSKTPDVLSLVLALPILLAFGWAVGIITGFVNVAFRDTQHILDVVFQIFFYLTPIIYQKEQLADSKVGFMMRYNPFVPMLDLVREPLFNAVAPSAAVWSTSILITLAVGLCALITLQYQQRRVVLYL